MEYFTIHLTLRFEKQGLEKASVIYKALVLLGPALNGWRCCQSEPHGKTLSSYALLPVWIDLNVLRRQTEFCFIKVCQK
ncbi:hypothetical protein ACQP3J_27625, partial [Escherichia coli]